MPRRRVFYSFDYESDVMRVQQIRNIGHFDDNKPVLPNEWEEFKKAGRDAIKKWIDASMAFRSCVVVLIGEDTANRYWVQYEIQKAWKEGKGIMGIFIHNLKCPRAGTCPKGENPFSQFMLENGQALSSLVPAFDPNPDDAYNDIKQHLSLWVEEGMSVRKYARSKLKQPQNEELA